MLLRSTVAPTTVWLKLPAGASRIASTAPGDDSRGHDSESDRGVKRTRHIGEREVLEIATVGPSLERDLVGREHAAIKHGTGVLVTLDEVHADNEILEGSPHYSSSENQVYCLVSEA